MRVMSCGSVLACAAAVLAGTAATPGASQEIGTAETVVRMVRGLRDVETRELAVNDNVFSEEVIETDVDSATRLVFLDGTELVMGPSSRMTLDRYIYDPDTGAGELAVDFATGVFEFASGDIPSEDYSLRTPLGNLTVRGTRFRLILPEQ